MDHILEHIQTYDALWREANALYSAWARSQGLSYSGLMVLLSLAEAERPQTQREICQQWLLPKQTVNTILGRFAELGWVELSSDPQDRRNKRILLTREGQARLGELSGALRSRERMVWQALGPERSQTLIEVTALYNRLFQEVTAP